MNNFSVSVFGWFMIRVYVLVDILDFVIVWFQSGAFKFIVVHSGWWGGGVVFICKTYLCTPRKLLRGAKNEGARDV